MKLKTWIAAVAMISATSVGSLVIESPASAAVWDCRAWVNPDGYLNAAKASCSSGFGSYRVAAECVSPYWPYVKTAYGPWKYRTSDSWPGSSYVWGDQHGCHITKARVEVG
ncbi:hypothetical protein Nm8I071_22910 [Nonomuraea sp. TT08I-71]|nr:hypothetical protein Nm8I071_22910 [Nonomuraea sp. TT08I-71]